MVAADEIRDVVLQAEGAVCSAIFTTAPGDRCTALPSAAEAVNAAAAVARDGHRGAVVLRADELLGALGAIHAAARARAPITVHVLGGGVGARSGRDELAPALDAGAGVLVTWSAQDSVDLALGARRAAEDSETPFVIFSDGGGPVMALPGSGLVGAFLGEGKRGGAAACTELESKRRERGYAARAPFALAAALRELSELTGRPLAPVERHETADADEVIVAVGQAFPAARAVATALRREGRRVGAVGVRALRPFFAAEVVKSMARARSVAVLEPLDVALAPAGPLAQSLKAAFADALTWAPGFPGVGRIPTIVSVAFATLEGAVDEGAVRAALAELAAGDRAKRLVVFGSGG